MREPLLQLGKSPSQYVVFVQLAGTNHRKVITDLPLVSLNLSPTQAVITARFHILGVGPENIKYLQGLMPSSRWNWLWFTLGATSQFLN